MAIALATLIRNASLDDLITAKIDAGAGAGKLRLYDGTRPATGGTVTTLLAELTMNDPSFPSAAAGTMTANAIVGDSSADATGTVTWFRIVDSNNTFVMDGNVDTSGSDLNVNTTSIQAGVPVDITSFIINAGNP